MWFSAFSLVRFISLPAGYIFLDEINRKREKNQKFLRNSHIYSDFLFSQEIANLTYYFICVITSCFPKNECVADDINKGAVSTF